MVGGQDNCNDYANMQYIPHYENQQIGYAGLGAHIGFGSTATLISRFFSVPLGQGQGPEVLGYLIVFESFSLELT